MKNQLSKIIQIGRKFLEIVCALKILSNPLMNKKEYSHQRIKNKNELYKVTYYLSRFGHEKLMPKRRFIPTVKKSAVPPIRFIDLRDIYASLLIKQNLPLIYIQEQLGHSSPQVTAERYKFLLEKNQVKSLNILDGVL